MIDPSSRRFPSISAWTSVPMRSSDWLSRRRCSATAVMYSAYSAPANIAVSRAVGSGEPSALSMSSDHRSRLSRSSGATPSMLPMTIMGRGAAMSLTKSADPCSHTRSMMASQMVRIPSSLSRIRLGVNPSLTSRRRRTCSGASVSTIIGRGKPSGRMPPALEKVPGSLETSRTSW